MIYTKFFVKVLINTLKFTLVETAFSTEKVFFFLNFVTLLNYCYLLCGFFRKKFGGSLYKSIFFKLYYFNFVRDCIIVEKAETLYFCFSHFKGHYLPLVAPRYKIFFGKGRIPPFLLPAPLLAGKRQTLNFGNHQAITLTWFGRYQYIAVR